jgi:hypothetical protein
MNKSSKRLTKKTISSTKSNLSSDFPSPTKIGPFKQSINLNFENITATNMNSNQIILTNSNNIILNDSLFKDTIKSSMVLPPVSTVSTISQQPFYLTPQSAHHHHYHHHVHHHNNKRKRQRTNDNESRVVNKSKVNRNFIGDDLSSSSSSNNKDSQQSQQSKRRQFNIFYSSY